MTHEAGELLLMEKTNCYVLDFFVGRIRIQKQSYLQTLSNFKLNKMIYRMFYLQEIKKDREPGIPSPSAGA